MKNIKISNVSLLKKNLLTFIFLFMLNNNDNVLNIICHVCNELTKITIYNYSKSDDSILVASFLIFQPPTPQIILHLIEFVPELNL